MELPRRRYMAALGLGILGVGGAAVIQFGDNNDLPYQSRFTGEIDTEEPIIHGTDVTIEDATPNQYAAVIRTEQEAKTKFRRNYLQNSVNLDLSDFIEADYPNEFHLLVGIVLPNPRNLNPQSIRLEDGTLHLTFSIDYVNHADSGATIHNFIQIFQRKDDAPAPNRVVPHFQNEVPTTG